MIKSFNFKLLLLLDLFWELIICLAGQKIKNKKFGVKSTMDDIQICIIIHLHNVIYYNVILWY